MLTAISGKNSLRIVDKINFSQLETDLLFHIDLRKGIYGRVYYEMGKAYSVVFTPLPFDPNSTEQNEFIYAINSIEGTNYSLDVLLGRF